VSSAQDLVGLLEKHGILFDIKADGLTIPSGPISSEYVQQARRELLHTKFLEIQRTEGDYAAWRMWQQSGDGFDMPEVKKIRKKSEKSRLLEDIAQSILGNEGDKAIELIGFYRDFAGPIDLGKIPLAGKIKAVENRCHLEKGQFGKIVAYLDKSNQYFGVLISNHRLLSKNDDLDDLDDEFSGELVNRNGIGYHAELIGRDMLALGGARYLIYNDVVTIWGRSEKYGKISHTLFSWVEECFKGFRVDNRQLYDDEEQKATLKHTLGYRFCSGFRQVLEALEEPGIETAIAPMPDDEEIPF
jgi:hypothetical protein